MKFARIKLCILLRLLNYILKYVTDIARNTCPLTPPLCPLTPQLCPLTPPLCPLTPPQCPLTPRLCPLTPPLCPLTPPLCPLTPPLCPLTPHLCSLTPLLCSLTPPVETQISSPELVALTTPLPLSPIQLLHSKEQVDVYQVLPYSNFHTFLVLSSLCKYVDDRLNIVLGHLNIDFGDLPRVAQVVSHTVAYYEIIQSGKI